MTTSGYLHPDYARSLAPYGCPRKLPASGGWILERPVPDFPWWDAMGCYPLFAAQNWAGLGDDLTALEQEGKLVALGLVADPFAPVGETELRAAFPLVRRYKEHVVVDLAHVTKSQISAHHRYYARRALASARVELVPEPLRYLDHWIRLYQELVQRHRLQGLHTFSPDVFATQLKIPGLLMFVAKVDDRVVGAHLWVIQGRVVYSHLAASDATGYALSVSYALYWSALQAFHTDWGSRLEWADLGAGSGETTEQDGLARFKRGWSPATRPVYFCGRVLHRSRYEAILAHRGLRDDPEVYFPPYRKGEFARTSPLP